MIDARWHSCNGIRRTRSWQLAVPVGVGILVICGILVFPISWIFEKAGISVTTEDLAGTPPLPGLIPDARKVVFPTVVEDLTQVPEVELQAPLARNLPRAEAVQQMRTVMAGINELNGQKRDGFLELLCRERPDLAGLPFALGDACRLTEECKQPFAEAVVTVRDAIALTARRNQHLINHQGNQGSDEVFWNCYRSVGSRRGPGQADNGEEAQEPVTLAHVGALMQMLGTESPAMRLGLVRHLSQVPHGETTRALARLAVFSAEGDVRQAALKALKIRRERDYTAVLLQGLHYPWPAVASRAAEAVVKLERNDLLPELVDLLDAPDPRAPVVRTQDGHPVPVVRELVRINHHKNCLLCHAPGNPNERASERLMATIPSPGEPLPSPADYYNRHSPGDLLVRFDVTYLRQDFSALQAVEDAHPWPKMQRFDFLVRTRVLAPGEAAAFQEHFGKQPPDQHSPYHRAARTALRELTGKDAGPTAAAWRRLLSLPANQQFLRRAS